MYRQSGRNDQEFRLLELDSGPNADCAAVPGTVAVARNRHGSFRTTHSNGPILSKIGICPGIHLGPLQPTILYDLGVALDPTQSDSMHFDISRMGVS